MRAAVGWPMWGLDDQEAMAMRVMVVGNSDGIGRALTQRLLARGDEVVGISRSPWPGEEAEAYTHFQLDVTADDYVERLVDIVAQWGAPQVVVYCAGIGELLVLEELAVQRRVFEVNLMGAVATLEVTLPPMLSAGQGHFVGLSSLADTGLSPQAPSYNASKAAMSRYLESMALAVADKGVSITNVRFGFVDTKMAKSDVRPMMFTVEQAVDRLMKIIDARRPPRRVTTPLPMAALVSLLSALMWLKLMI